MRPTPSLVLSATALVVAVLGTTPLAAIAQNAALPRNSVGSTQLKRSAVTAAKITPDAVRAAHVQNGSLLAEDFKPGQLPQGPRGDKGDRGDKGEKGDPGVKGEPGTAQAWARVAGDGTVVAGVNVTGAERGGTGQYCVFLNAPNAHIAAAATAHGGTGNRRLASTSPEGCTTGSERGVLVTVWEGSAFVNADFTVIVP